jgi:hypothetical protein
MTDPIFVCSVCQKEFKGDAKDTMTECRVCHRIHCKDCVDEFGNCVECKEPGPAKE